MKPQDYQRKIAQLESINEHLEHELLELDRLLRRAGFSQGVESVRRAVTEILEEAGDLDL